MISKSKYAALYSSETIWNAHFDQVSIREVLGLRPEYGCYPTLCLQIYLICKGQWLTGGVPLLPWICRDCYWYPGCTIGQLECISFIQQPDGSYLINRFVPQLHGFVVITSSSTVGRKLMGTRRHDICIACTTKSLVASIFAVEISHMNTQCYLAHLGISGRWIDR